MSMSTALRSETIDWLLGAALLGGLSAVAYSLGGWVGIGTIGLLGLVTSTKIDLHGGHDGADGGYGGGVGPLYARQLEEVQKSQTSREQKMAAAAVQAKRSTVLSLLNTAFIAMTVLGIASFILH